MAAGAAVHVGARSRLTPQLGQVREKPKEEARLTNSDPSRTAMAPRIVDSGNGSSREKCAMPMVQIGMRLW